MASMNGSFEVVSWTEEAYEERHGRRLTRASVSQRFVGDIAGDGTAEWLMAYQPDDRARFVGFQYVDAIIGGRPGTWVFETKGQFDSARSAGRPPFPPADGGRGVPAAKRGAVGVTSRPAQSRCPACPRRVWGDPAPASRSWSNARRT